MYTFHLKPILGMRLYISECKETEETKPMVLIIIGRAPFIVDDVVVLAWIIYCGYYSVKHAPFPIHATFLSCAVYKHNCVVDVLYMKKKTFRDTLNAKDMTKYIFNQPNFFC